MKKLKKIIRFLMILLATTSFFAFIGYFIVMFFWRFNILDLSHYRSLYVFWMKGGVFNTFSDLSLLLCLLLLPILIIKYTKKLYKQGFWKNVLSPFIKLYKRVTRPKNLETEHVSIKNLGAKDKTLEEIIADKIKEKGEKQHQNTLQDIRSQITEKIKENESQ